MRKGMGERRTGSWGYRGMVKNKVLLKSIRKYINYPVINHTKKNKKKNIYVFSVCIYIFSHVGVHQKLTQHCKSTMCAYVLSRFSHVQLFVTPLTVVLQALLSMGLSG